jgi:predicted transcriptional regulator
MRTTLTIDDRIARKLKALAHRSGKPFKVVVNEALQAGLIARQEPRKPKRYRLRTASLGRVCRGINLDKALALADSLEDGLLPAI